LRAPILNPNIIEQAHQVPSRRQRYAAIAASRVGAVVVLRVARHRTPNLKMRILNLI
jgi:hypothetical protein